MATASVRYDTTSVWIRTGPGAPTSPAAGLSNNDIAGRLTLSAGTVRLHVSNILAKLEAPNRTTAVVLAMKHGLV